MTAVVLPDPTGLSHSTNPGVTLAVRQAVYTAFRSLVLSSLRPSPNPVT